MSNYGDGAALQSASPPGCAPPLTPPPRRPRAAAAPKRHHYFEQEAVFRFVVNVADTALIIGRGGGTVRQIEQEFLARVKRLQEPPGTREQVVIVWSKPMGMPPGELVPAQRALLDCVRRVVTQENPRDASGAAPSVKLLVNRSQAAAVGPATEERLRAEMGVTLRVARGEDLPACALDTDVLVELSGDRYQLLNAVEVVTAAVLAVPPTERLGGPPPALTALSSGGGGGGGYGRY